jgi:anti-anti-sigma factor
MNAMPLERWSDKVVVVRLADDPQLTEDLVALEHASQHGPVDAVLDFDGVKYINSSNLAKLLKLRKKMVSDGTRLILCGIGDQVWGALLVTGLDKLFSVCDDVATGLASLQMR